MNDAREACRNARAVAGKVARESHEPADLRALALDCELLATLHMQAYESDVAAPLYAEALRIWDDLLAAHRLPADSEIRHHRALGLRNMGNLYRIQGDERALSFLRRAENDLKGLTADDPKPEYRKNLCELYQSLGKFLASSGELKEARDYHEQNHAVWTELWRDYPDRHEYLWGQAASLHHLGDVDNPAFHHPGRPGPSEASYKAALQIWADEILRSPERPQLQNERARALFGLANLYAATGSTDKARDYALQPEKAWKNLPSGTVADSEKAYREKLRRLLDDLKKKRAG